MNDATAAEKAVAAWGAMPDWITALAAACDASSQSAVAERLAVNQAYLSYAIRNQKPQYHGPVEDAVRSRLMGTTLDCPVLGEIAPDVCRAHRRSRRRALGPVEKRLRNTCPACIFNTDRTREATDADQ